METRTSGFPCRTVLAAMLCAAIWLSLSNAAHADTLSDIQNRGILKCGVTDSGEGVSKLDTNGQWQGFFPEFCRFIAATVLGNSQAVEFVEASRITRFDALNGKAYDVLVANTTWTVTRDTDLKLSFTHPVYYDGQGFLVHRSLNITSMEDLAPDRSVTACVSEGTTTLSNLQDYVETHALPIDILSFQSMDSVRESFLSRDCDIITNDRMALVAMRHQQSDSKDDFVLLSDVISKEPLGPAVRQDDQKWFDIVQWSVYASVIAEECGITRDNISDFLSTQKPEVRRLLGLDPGIGEGLGLSDDWARNAISQVGSYGEIFERTLGSQSPLQMDRGLNALWRDGGLMYAPPLR